MSATCSLAAYDYLIGGTKRSRLQVSTFARIPVATHNWDVSADRARTVSPETSRYGPVLYPTCCALW
jgi:hypothetical protein